MGKCCIFSCPNAETAWKQLEFEVVERFGDPFRNLDGTFNQNIIRLDDGRCSFIRCKNCGAHFIYYFSEALVYYGSDDDVYFTESGLLPVADREEALHYSKDYSGISIERNPERLGIWEDNGRWTWNVGDIE